MVNRIRQYRKQDGEIHRGSLGFNAEIHVEIVF